jgi:hypothetical protein
MKTYISRETNNEKSWVQYLLAVFTGLVPLLLSIALYPTTMTGASFSLSMMLMFTAGIIFSGLGVYSSVKDQHKGFAMICLTAGAVLIGAPQLLFLL